MSILESINVDDKVVNIYNDENLENPRIIFDHNNVMVCSHKRYILGDKQVTTNDFESWNDLENKIKKENDVAMILPLYMLDHSGITISVNDFNDPWDSGKIGYIYITKDNVRKAFDVKRITEKVLENVHKSLVASVEEYDQYLRGDVYGYEVTDKDGEVLDSCWGFYGYEYAKEQALEAGKNCKVPEKENPNQLKLALDA